MKNIQHLAGALAWIFFLNFVGIVIELAVFSTAEISLSEISFSNLSTTCWILQILYSGSVFFTAIYCGCKSYENS